MNLKTFGILSVITVLLIFLALQMSSKQPTSSDAPMTYLYPDLLSKINDVTEISITEKQQTLNLSNHAGQWQLQQKANYPADNNKINQLLANVAQMQTIEAKTKNPTLYDKLGVTDADKIITLKQKDGSVLADLIIGNNRTAKGDSTQHQVYVRKRDDAQTWLVSGQIDLAHKAVDWLERTLLDLNETRVQSVVFNTNADETLTISKENKEAKDYQLADLAEGEELSSDFVLKTTASLLSNLQFDDVIPVAELSFKDKENATFTTFDGLQVKVFLADKEERTYMKLVTASTAETSAEEAQTLQDKLSPWAYAIAQYKLDSFNKVRADFIKQPEPEAVEETAATNTDSDVPENPFAAAVAASKAQAQTPPTVAQIEATNKLKAALEQAAAKKAAESAPAPVETVPAAATAQATTTDTETQIEVTDQLEAATGNMGSQAAETMPTPEVDAKKEASYLDRLKSVAEKTKDTVIQEGKSAIDSTLNSEATQEIKALVDDTKTAVKQTGSEVVEGVKSVTDNPKVQSVVDNVKSGVNTATEVVKEGVEKVKNAVETSTAPAEASAEMPVVPVEPAPSVETPAAPVEVAPAPVVETPATPVESTPAPTPESSSYLERLKSVAEKTKDTVMSEGKTAIDATLNSDAVKEIKGVVAETTTAVKQGSSEAINEVKAIADNEQVQTVVDTIKSGASTVSDKVKVGADKLMETVKPETEKTEP